MTPSSPRRPRPTCWPNFSRPAWRMGAGEAGGRRGWPARPQPAPTAPSSLSPAADAACDGLTTLASRTSPATLTPAAAAAAASALCVRRLVDARSLPRPARQASLACLEALLAPPHGAAITAAGVDALGGAAAAADGERDPRCLLSGLRAVAAAAALAAAGGAPGAASLAASGEEAVDVVGCYFPVQFSPPPPGAPPAPVTRRALVAAVVGALTAAPAFAGRVVPLAVERVGGGGARAPRATRGLCWLG